MTYKALLACDLDGTLIPDDGVIPSHDLSLLRKLPSMGILPVLASGRPALSVCRVAQSIWGDYELPVISFNGSLVLTPLTKQELFSVSIDNRLARKIISYVIEKGFFPQVYDSNMFYVFASDERAERYSKSVGMPYKVIDYSDFTWNSPKILLHDMPDRLNSIFYELKKDFAGQVKIFFSKPIYIEIVNPDSGKGLALKKLAQLYNIEQSMTWAMGDAENDLDMLLAAGHGYAVANASRFVKEKVKYITKNEVAKGALSEVVESILSVIRK